MIQTSHVVTRNFHRRPDVFEPQSRIQGIFRVLRFVASVKGYGAAM
jgi:hypothetical protein